LKNQQLYNHADVAEVILKGLALAYLHFWLKESVLPQTNAFLLFSFKSMSFKKYFSLE